LWNQFEKLRELILSDRMPIWADEERKRMHDSTEALAARRDWNVHPEPAYHRRIKKRPSPRFPVPTEDIEKHLKVFGIQDRPRRMNISFLRMCRRGIYRRHRRAH
jgi:hypothetical protein